MTEQSEVEDGLKELGLIVAGNREEEVWGRVVQNMTNVVAELEKQLKEIPSQIEVNKSILEFAKSKAPKPLNAT